MHLAEGFEKMPVSLFAGENLKIDYLKKQPMKQIQSRCSAAQAVHNTTTGRHYPQPENL
jgi:hypothetical protein